MDTDTALVWISVVNAVAVVLVALIQHCRRARVWHNRSQNK